MTIATEKLDIFCGDFPPLVKGSSKSPLWLSTAYDDLYVSASEVQRLPVLVDGGTDAAGLANEPTVWYYNGLWHMYYHSSSRVFYATAQDWRGPWTKYGKVTGMTSIACVHGSAYIEGNTLYFFYTKSNVYYYASTTLDNPMGLTEIGSALDLVTAITHMTLTATGNAHVVKSPWDGQYYLFVEGQSSSAAWQPGVFKSSSIAGPWTLVDFPSKSLWPCRGFNGLIGTAPAADVTEQLGSQTFQAWSNKNYGGGHHVVFSGDYAYCYYHAGTTTNGLPTTIWLAKSHKSEFPINWKIINNGWTLINRRHPLEVDQVSDFCLAEGPNGTRVAFWTGMRNNTLQGVIMASELKSPLKRWNGYSWDNVLGGQESQHGADAFLDQFWPASFPNTGFSHMDDVIISTGSGNVTAYLPGASRGAKIRITNVGHASNTVTMTPIGTDAFRVAGAGVVAAGTSVDFRCYESGYWVRAG